MLNNSCLPTKRRILFHTGLVSFQAGLVNFTSLLDYCMFTELQSALKERNIGEDNVPLF